VSERQQTRALLAEPWPADLLSGGDPSAAFARFLQADVPPELRQDHGLHRVLSSIFPIRDFNEIVELHYVHYRVTPPERSPEECRRRSETHAGSLHLTLHLVVFDVDDPTKSMNERVLSLRDIKEQEVYLGEIPWKTRENTFVIDGIDRVILRQIAESPGVRFLPGQGGKLKATITPHRGSRLSFELDRKGLLWTRVDARKKRFLATTLLRALGFPAETILATFCPVETILLGPGGQCQVRLDLQTLLGQRCTRDIRAGDEILVRRHQKFLRNTIRQLRERRIDRIPVDGDSLLGRPLARDVVHQDSGEVLREANDPLQPGDLERFHAAGLSEVSLVLADGLLASQVIPETLRADRNATEDDALCAIYSALRPGDAPTVETARHLLDNLFFRPDRYDLSAAGRRSLHRKLHGGDPDAPVDPVLSCADLLATVRELLHRDLRGLPPDDLDHVQEAVVRDPCALLEDVFRLGLIRLERTVKERLSMSMEPELLLPHDVVSGRPIQRILADFFGWSRVSERVDFTSPVAELSQRRRVSSAEPDHTSYKRTSYRRRPVHESHLGAFCAAERPRSGLALALSCRVDDAGGLLPSCAPFTDRPDPDAPPPRPWDLLGLPAALVPFLHHDAAEIGPRCVANLLDALPPLAPEPPRVAAGLEAEVAHASGLSVLAPTGGTVRGVNAREVVVDTDSGPLSLPLRSFELAPRGAYVRQRPVVRRGQRVEPGDLLAAGPGVACGEVALGHNLTVALVSGPTFGTSLVASERLLHQGKFTTLRLREHKIYVASSGDGDEVFSAEIPGVDEEDRAHLDGRGLARVGARVRGGELLIGRVRTRAWNTPEELPEVQDRSLRMPAGRDGVVIGAWLESKREATMPRKAQARARVLVAELHPLSPGDLLGSRHGDRGTVARIAPVEDMPLLPDGTPVDLLLNPAYIAEEGAAGLLMELLAGALGIPLVAPPFGATLTEAQLRMRLGGDGRLRLRDGATGEFLEELATVGTLYVMKLPPLASEASEARSTGPTDPLTGLPVEGDGVAPGQLFDEDSVAALMAHGAAFTLRELLVHKGDAPSAREANPRMLQKHEEPADHVTRSLDALMRELRAAALEVQGIPSAAAPPPDQE
jgi:DNA-directed RNA polymerase subunit beta